MRDPSQGEFSIMRQRELREVGNFTGVSLLNFLFPAPLTNKCSLEIRNDGMSNA